MKPVTTIMIGLCTLALVGCAGTYGAAKRAANIQSAAAAQVPSQAGAIDVKAALQRIHRLYNQRKFDALLALATEPMKQRISRKQFLNAIKHVRGTLGAVRSWQVIRQRTSAAGKRLVVARVQYENGSGMERWVVQATEHGVRWAEFFYDSPSLSPAQ